MILAARFGGGPAYWGLPEVADEEVVSTAMDIIVKELEKRTHRE